MRTSTTQRSWFPRSNFALFVLFLVFPQFHTRSVINVTLVSEDGVDKSVPSERIETEGRELPAEKEEVGIRRLDTEAPEGDKGIHIGSETHVQISEVIRETGESAQPNSVIESLKQNAALLQQQIKDNTLFQSLKEPVLVMPDVPLLAESDILQALKSVSQVKKHDFSIEPLSHHLLSDKQFEIIQSSVSLIAEQQRQTYLQSMYSCVRNLSVMNCMRIFIYPILAETVPQFIIQNMPGLPIEISVSDFLPNRTKSARSTLFLYPLVTEELLIQILKDALDTQRSVTPEPSYIDPMNETFVKLLSPGQMKILQMAEKILPVESRREYSDRMYSCVKRFEYFSCLRYFAWPMMKKHHQALPNFPEYEILYPVPTFTEYPILPFPVGPGLPEVIEADLSKPKPEALILRILREGINPRSNFTELLPLRQMIHTLPFPTYIPNIQPVPIRDQLTSLYVARQILPPQLRAEFHSQSLKCIQEVSYYPCMKYYTWPIVRQAQPTLPQFPDLTEWFQIPDWFQLPDFTGFFQLPSFPFAQPELPIPQIPVRPEIPMIPNPTIPQFPIPNATIPQFPIPNATIPQFPIPNATIPQFPIPQFPNSTTPQISESRNSKPEFPIISITGTEFQLLSENPETIIFTILRLYQISDPTLLNTLSIPFLNSSTSSLTLHQENTILLAKNMLPESARAPFSEQMTSCLSEKDFLTCSKDLMFPTLSKYFPNLPPFPIFATPEKPQAQILETNTKTDKHVTITDTRFIPISEHPEKLVLNILRSLQTPSPNGSNTRDLNTQLNDQQLSILEIAESLIPDHLRETFVQRTIECSRNNLFLNCARDIIFPTVSQYHPNIPQFPNFEVLHKPEITEVESTLRTETTKAQELGNMIKLDGILPEEIRPAYHARMLECMQTSSFVSCMQNIDWPILRLKPLLSTQPAENLQILPDVPGSSNDADITSSVGRFSDIGQPIAIFVDPSKERDDPVKSEESKSRRKRSLTLLDSYPQHEPDENKTSVRRNLPKSIFPNMTESELLQLLIRIKNSNFHTLGSRKYFVDGLDSEVRKTLTADQVQILRLVEDLSPETSRGIMTQLWQCIRGLSILRCAGVFIWPMISSNLPSLGLFSRQSRVDSVQEFFGMPPNDFEKELMVKKQEFEDVLLSWYKSLMEDKFETNFGFLKVKGHGNGELGLSLSGFREGRAKIIKDNKNLPSILTIISDIMEDVLEPKPNSNRNRKDPKKGKSLKFEENYQEESLAALLEKMRSNDSDTKNDNRHFSLEDAYKAFELLFGTKLINEIESKLKSLNFEESSKNGIESTLKKKHKTELSVQLPRLNDMISKKMTSNLNTLGRNLKTKMTQMMPGIGLVVSFILQMAIAHAKTAASLAGVMSNMALGMGMFSMIRDALFGQTNNPKVKYVYDTDIKDPGVSWPKESSYWK